MRSAPDQELLETIRGILAQDFGVPREELAADTHLVDDLDFDSIDAVDLAHRVEEETGLALPEESFEAVRTLGDIVALLAGDAPPPAQGSAPERGAAQ